MVTARQPNISSGYENRAEYRAREDGTSELRSEKDSEVQVRNPPRRVDRLVESMNRAMEYMLRRRNAATMKGLLFQSQGNPLLAGCDGMSYYITIVYADLSNRTLNGGPEQSFVDRCLVGCLFPFG